MRILRLEVLGYGLASGIALAADTAILEGLVKLGGWHYLPASAVAFATGSVVAYLLSVKFVFRFRRVTNNLLEFGYFAALGVAGLLVNAAALFVAVSLAGLSLLVAKLLAAGCTFVTNFTFRKQLLFAPTESV
jgi:putative flippase GtrA